MLKQKDDEAVQTRATIERFANAVSKKPTNMPRPLQQQQQNILCKRNKAKLSAVTKKTTHKQTTAQFLSNSICRPSVEGQAVISFALLLSQTHRHTHTHTKKPFLYTLLFINAAKYCWVALGHGSNQNFCLLTARALYLSLSLSVSVIKTKKTSKSKQHNNWTTVTVWHDTVIPHALVYWNARPNAKICSISTFADH